MARTSPAGTATRGCGRSRRAVRRGNDHRESREGKHIPDLEGRMTKDFDLRLSFRCNATNNRGSNIGPSTLRGKSETKAGWCAANQQEFATRSCRASGSIYDEGERRGHLPRRREGSLGRSRGEEGGHSGPLIDQAGFEAVQARRLERRGDHRQGEHIGHYLNNG